MALQIREKREGGCELLHLLGSQDECVLPVSSRQRGLDPSPLPPLEDSSVSPQLRQLEDPGSGLHSH